MPDITVRNEGSIFLLTPRTTDATEFLEVNTDGQWFGASLVVEHRYVADLVTGLRDAGFTVGDA